MDLLKQTARALRFLLPPLVICLAVVQVGIVPVTLRWISVAWVELAGALEFVTATVVAGLLGVQVAAVAVWRLAGLAIRDRVFSPSSLRWADAMVAGAVLLAAAIVTVLVTTIALRLNAGGVLLVLTAALLATGAACVAGVARGLLRQAIRLEARPVAVA